jgi:mono/diheme cytochrome c family protein
VERRGGLLATAPFHWEGDMPDVAHLVDDVFTVRMGGPALADDQMAALAGWLDGLGETPPSPPADAQAAARGFALFASPDVGCTSCHAGAALTDNATVDVGRGAFQVPSLRGVALRAPYLHDGCAATLRDRFGPCGGGDMHGRTSSLTDAQIDDLVAYLETL